MKSIAAIIFIVLFGYIGVKVSLAYADKSTLVSSIEAVDKKNRLSHLTDVEIAAVLIREFKKNGVGYIHADDINIVGDDEHHEVQVSLEYDAHVALLGQMGFTISMKTDKQYLED